MVLFKRPDDPLWAYKSYFGTQFNSKKRTAPEWRFGSTELPTLLPTIPSGMPPPGTYNPNGVLPNLNYPHKTQLSWSSCPTPRSSVADRAQRAPGPAHYTTCTAAMMGQDLPIADKINTPRFTWSRCSTRQSRVCTYVSRDHERELLGLHSPGPHTVGRQAYDSMGQQHNSTRKTAPRFTQGKEKRFMMLRAADASLTPGPGSYNV